MAADRRASRSPEPAGEATTAGALRRSRAWSWPPCAGGPIGSAIRSPGPRC